MTRRSIILVTCGALAVLVGIAVAFIGRWDEDAPSSADEVSVLVTTGGIGAGTSGETAMDDGSVVVDHVPSGDRAAGALSDPSQLTGRTIDVAVASGSQLLVSDLNTPALRDGAVEVPEGTEAVAIEVPFINGVAGYAAPGDEVNVFALLDVAEGTTAVPANSTVGVLSNVVVLDVSQELAPRVAAQTGAVAATSTSTTPTAAPAKLTYLLAVPVADVARLVQAAAYHRLYLSIPADGTPPVPVTVISDADLAGGGG